jgi:hypothetical protein
MAWRKAPRCLWNVIGATILLSGCHIGPPDVLGLSDKLAWESDEAIVLCSGETIPVPVVKYGVDSASNTWVPVPLDTASLFIRIQDTRIVTAAGHRSISGSDTGTTLISILDTTEQLSAPWRKATVKSCR